MDIQMPHVDGIEATARLVAGDGTNPRGIILTTFDVSEYVYRALQAGASGFLLKDAGPELLGQADEVVLLEDGLATATGTHRELLDHPAYRHIVIRGEEDDQ